MCVEKRFFKFRIVSFEYVKSQKKESNFSFSCCFIKRKEKVEVQDYENRDMIV